MIIQQKPFYPKNIIELDENSDYIAFLKSVYGDRVKTPFGYFSKSINIKV